MYVSDSKCEYLFSMMIVLPYNCQKAIVYICDHLAVHVFHSFPTQVDDQGIELHLRSAFWGWFTMNPGNKAQALTFRPLCGCICPHTWDQYTDQK